MFFLLFCCTTVKPNCTIARKEVDDEDTLVCVAFGNPPELDFGWSVKAENETYEVMSARQEGTVSFLVLDEEFLETRTYRCVANNSVGIGSFCEIDVAGKFIFKIVLFHNTTQLYPPTYLQPLFNSE